MSQYLKDLRRMRELKTFLFAKRKEMGKVNSSWGNGYALAVEETLTFLGYADHTPPKQMKSPSAIPYLFFKKLNAKK